MDLARVPTALSCVFRPKAPLGSEAVAAQKTTKAPLNVPGYRSCNKHQLVVQFGDFRTLGHSAMRHLPCLILIALMLLGCGQTPEATKPVDSAAKPKAVEQRPTEKAGPAAKLPEVKDIVQVTPAAAARLREKLKEMEVRGYLRVSATDDYKFSLDLDGSLDEHNDLVSESQGIPIVIDRKSAQLIPPGLTVDFVTKAGKFSIRMAEPDPGSIDTSVSLAQARKGFKTKLTRREAGGNPPPVPPAEVFRLVHYDAPPGKLAAYLTLDPKDGQKHPAIIWIIGGDCNSIEPTAWNTDDEESASPYRQAGIVMMFASLRGGNDNPGVKEGFLGEVDDIVAAAAYLRQQPFVDPDRIYLGGHSTGGTLALLTAEYSDQFRAVFSFGPVSDLLGHASRYCPFVMSDAKELHLPCSGALGALDLQSDICF